MFPTSDTLTVIGWQGSIVAPNQAVTLNSNGQFDGSIFAASISGGGQTNFDPFGGTAPSTADPLPALSEGLPIAMGGLAVLGFAALMVRRRKGRPSAGPSSHHLRGPDFEILRRRPGRGQRPGGFGQRTNSS